jgi:hypothetical protein
MFPLALGIYFPTSFVSGYLGFSAALVGVLTVVLVSGVLAGVLAGDLLGT